MDKKLEKFLQQKFQLYCQEEFITTDPIQIPHLFHQKQDIEIAGLLTSTIAWGKRKSIIKNAHQIMEIMDFSPYDFIIHGRLKDFEKATNFVHRTFNYLDLTYFFKALKKLYFGAESLEDYFLIKAEEPNTFHAIERFREKFLFEPDFRTQKHISSPAKNSAAKRLNMFLRWMVRDNPVDFGLWEKIPKEKLIIPLDVHSGRVARSLNLLQRKANDWKSAEFLTNELKKYDAKDPVKFDFALFGIGAFE